MEVRELEGLDDLLDPLVEPTDVGVGDVGDFLEQEVFQFALG